MEGSEKHAVRLFDKREKQTERETFGAQTDRPTDRPTTRLYLSRHVEPSHPSPARSLACFVPCERVRVRGLESRGRMKKGGPVEEERFVFITRAVAWVRTGRAGCVPTMAVRGLLDGWLTGWLTEARSTGENSTWRVSTGRTRVVVAAGINGVPQGYVRSVRARARACSPRTARGGEPWRETAPKRTRRMFDGV